MATYVPAKRATEFIFYMGLVSQATGQFQANPTLAAGDVKVSKDGGALANLTTLPAVTPAASKVVKVTISSTEMTADNVALVFSDAAGAEWDDCIVNIQAAANQIDDLATAAALATVQADTDNIQTRLPAALSGDGFMKSDLKSIEDELTSGNNATLNLKKLNVVNNAGDAFVAQSTSSNGIGIYAIGGSGLGTGIFALGGGYGSFFEGQGAGGKGVVISGDDGIGLEIGSSTTHALQLNGAGTGKSINAPQNIAVSDGDLTLAAIASAVWTNATRTLTAISDSAGITTLLSRITAALGIYTAADVRGAVGLASANLDAQLDALPTATENADELLKRDWTAVTGEAARSVLNALRKLRNKVSYASPTLTTTKEDDATTAYTQTVTTDDTQEPFKEVG